MISAVASLICAIIILVFFNLCRAGLRRVGAADLPEQHGGARRGAQQPEPPRVPGDRRRQGRRGAELPAHGLLRRHRRLRGARQRQPDGQPPVPGALGPARRQRLPRHGRRQQPAPADVQRVAAGGQLRCQKPHRRGDGHPLRRPHRRPLLLHLLPQPHLQRVHPDRKPFIPLVVVLVDQHALHVSIEIS
jgi:hypothetical protein